jgi:hypothetical protein
MIQTWCDLGLAEAEQRQADRDARDAACQAEPERELEAG